MNNDTVITKLKEEYNEDELYFETLSAWHNSGKFANRIHPMLRLLRPFLGKPTKALDAGCAAGAFAIELAKYGVQSIDAIDFSSTALRISHQNAIQHRVADRIRFIESKLEQLNGIEDNSYDVIVAADVIEHIVEPAVFMREMWRVCKPGGVILIETPNMLFRRHPWYSKLNTICRQLHLPESTNRYPVNKSNNWERYHVSLFNWPDLVELMRSEHWSIVRESAFGWWLQLGAADTLMSWLSRGGRLFDKQLRYYGNTDVVIIARKAPIS